MNNTSLSLAAPIFFTALSICGLNTAYGASSQCPAQETRSNQSESSAFSQINQRFRQSYSQTKQDLLKESGPVIIVSHNLVLLKSGKRKEVSYLPDEYTLLKVVDHSPLAIFVTLTEHTGILDSPRKSALNDLHKLMAAARAELSKEQLPDNLRIRQDFILEKSIHFIDHVIEEDQCSKDELLAFAAEMGPPTLANADDAAAIEIASLDKQMRNLRQEMTPEEWESLHVIIEGSHMARQQEVALQYFLHLFHEDQEGKHLIYAESPTSDEQALNLLATHLIDSRIGKAFFGDPMRMHRDMMSDGARKYLDEHPLKPIP